MKKQRNSWVNACPGCSKRTRVTRHLYEGRTRLSRTGHKLPDGRWCDGKPTLRQLAVEIAQSLNTGGVA